MVFFGGGYDLSTISRKMRSLEGPRCRSWCTREREAHLRKALSEYTKDAHLACRNSFCWCKFARIAVLALPRAVSAGSASSAREGSPRILEREHDSNLGFGDACYPATSRVSSRSWYCIARPDPCVQDQIPRVVYTFHDGR